MLNKLIYVTYANNINIDSMEIVRKMSKKNVLNLIIFGLMLFWIAQLLESDCYHIIYIILFLLLIICYISQLQSKKFITDLHLNCSYNNILIIFFSSILSSFIVISNYKLWIYKIPHWFDLKLVFLIDLLIINLLFFGGLIVFYNIFFFGRYFHSTSRIS